MGSVTKRVLLARQQTPLFVFLLFSATKGKTINCYFPLLVMDCGSWSSERVSSLPPQLRTELRLFLEIGREKVISHQAFKLFDKDGDGLVTLSELMSLIKKVGGSMTEQEARALLEQADQDGNEGVDYQEFTRLWSIIRAPIGMKEATKTLEALDVDQ